MSIGLKRAYENPDDRDGYRVLVDRVWPRGVARGEAKIDRWMKEAAPSPQLRKWFHADPSRWEEFRRRYRAELEGRRDALRQLARRAASENVTLVFGSRDVERNNAVVLKEFLETLGA